MSIFFLKEGVFLVEGASGAAVYDTNNGLVYSLNKAASKILREYRGDEAFLSQVESLGIKPENPDQVAPLSFSESEIPQSSLDFLWLEVTDRCNLRCAHCYGSFGYNPTPGSFALSFEEWKAIIDQAYEIGNRQIQLIGGEPVLFRNKGRNYLDLAGYAVSRGLSVEVFTNGTLVGEDDVKRAKEMGLRFAVSLYSNNPDVHDAVTGKKGSWRNTMSAIELLRKYSVPFRIGFVAMSINEKTIEDTAGFIASLGVRRSSPDVIRPVGSGGGNGNLSPSLDLVKKYALRMSPDFSTDYRSFIRNVFLNPCLAGKLAVTADGRVIPCIFARDIVLGDVKKNALVDIISSEATQGIWRLSLDQISVCGDCEFRYACHDCRPLAMSSDTFRDLTSPNPRCTYNPYAREWGKGVWRRRFPDKENFEYFPID